MVRREEGYIVRSYFKSFKENFLQATIIWILFLLFLGIFFLDIYLTGGGGSSTLQLPFVVRALLIAGGGYAFLMYLHVFPLLSRFHNTVAGTIANSAKIAAAYFPRTLAMAVVTVLSGDSFVSVYGISLHTSAAAAHIVWTDRPWVAVRYDLQQHF